MNNDSRDARALSRETQAELRRIAVRLAEGTELTHAEIAAAFDVHEDTISRWCVRARQEGEEAFQASTTPTGPAPTYTEAQEVWIVEQLRLHPDPREFGYARAGWTLALIKHWLEHTPEIGFAPDPSTLGKMLRRRRFRYRSLRTQAEDAKEEEQRHFVEEIWPEVCEQAREPGVTMVFLDECGVRQDQVKLRGWVPQGSRVRLSVSGKRKRTNVSGAVTPAGALWFEQYSDNLTGPRFVEQLKRLRAHWPTQHIVVVTDKHSAHTARCVEDYIAEVGGIELVFLPGYTPWWNPQQGLWQLLKHHIHRAYPVQQGESLTQAVAFEMEELQSQPHKIQKIFHHPDLEPIRKKIPPSAWQRRTAQQQQSIQQQSSQTRLLRAS